MTKFAQQVAPERGVRHQKAPMTFFTYTYDIKPKQEGYARVFVTSDGSFACISDWGSYTSWWSAFGSDIRAFLLRCNDDYLIGRLGNGEQAFDREATVAGIKQEILTHRRHRDAGWDSYAARSEWRDASRIESECDFNRWFETRESTHWDEPWRYAKSAPPRRLQMFMKRVWPLLRAAMQQDLERESILAAGGVVITTTPSPSG